MTATAHARCDHGILAGSRRCVVRSCPEYDGKGAIDALRPAPAAPRLRQLAAVTVAQSRAVAPPEPTPAPVAAPPRRSLPPIDVSLAVASALAQRHAAELYAERHLTRRDDCE
jgi:hypothetical protein